MDFSIPSEFTEEILKFKDFLKARVIPELAAWYQSREIPARIFKDFAAGGWYGIGATDQLLTRRPALWWI